MDQQIINCINNGDIDGAIRQFTFLDLKYEEGILMSAEAQRPAQHFYTAFLACYLLKGDLDSAKYLWKRVPQQWKVSASGTMLPEMWEVGKALWRGESAAALVNLSVSWPTELVLLAEKLRVAVELNVLRTVQRSYEQISLENLALRLNTTPQSLGLKLESMGWIVDRNAGIVRPAPCEPESVFKTIRYEANENHALLQKITGFAAQLGKETTKVEK